MMCRFSNTKGFSLIELMVVMAIMAVIMSLSGGLLQKSISQQERLVEIEKVKQIFNQLIYRAYYQGETIQVRLEENKLIVQTKAALQDITNFDHTKNNNHYFDDIKEFTHLVFVAQTYAITSKGIVLPSTYGILTENDVKKFQLSAIFKQNENQ